MSSYTGVLFVSEWVQITSQYLKMSENQKRKEKKKKEKASKDRMYLKMYQSIAEL